MTIDISGAKLDATSTNFILKNTSDVTIFSRGISSSGQQNFAFYENASIPAFISGRNSDPGWILPGASGGWYKINNYCTVTSYNKGSHYNTSTTRFTAPITGPYWFCFSTYLYTSSYVHPVFAINGSVTSGYYTQYRIRGHGMTANYQQDAQIEEVMYLTAGNFVEVFWYSSGNSYHYPFYSLFQGAYVG